MWCLFNYALLSNLLWVDEKGDGVLERVCIVIPPEKLAAALSKAFTKPLLARLEKESTSKLASGS